MMWSKGDHVEYKSHCSDHVFRGQIEGFYGKHHDVAFCTDQTGRPSRPVNVSRLRRPAQVFWYNGKVA